MGCFSIQPKISPLTFSFYILKFAQTYTFLIQQIIIDQIARQALHILKMRSMQRQE